MADLPKRKRIRLGRDPYRQTSMICAITIAVRDREPVFSATSVANVAVEILRRLATQTGVRMYVYCLMPDHVHLVISPSTDCDIVTFVGRYKNLVLREAWRLGIQGSFWQASFWDHFLRGEEDVRSVVVFVLNNSVRGGLVGAWREYPFAGSLVFDDSDLG